MFGWGMISPPARRWRRAYRDKEESMLNAGEQAPDFSLPSQSGGKVTLKDFRGQRLVLYFFPKAGTPG